MGRAIVDNCMVDAEEEKQTDPQAYSFIDEEADEEKRYEAKE